ncbi:MAG: sulfotransferase [Chromatiales bacterium]|jgi:hypothetical protein
MPELKKISKLLDPEIRAKNIDAILIRARERYWHMFGKEMPDPVFILGCSRSGTTVTYETISAAPNFLTFGYELLTFWDSLYGLQHNDWDSDAAFAKDARIRHRKQFFAHAFGRLGHGRILDKTCINALRGTYLYELFPNAQFVYIQRDGRDNISSMMDSWNKDSNFGLNKYLGAPEEEIAIENGKFDQWRLFYPPGWRDYNHSSLEEVCAFQWVQANQHCLQAKAVIPPDQWTHLHYEDLFTRPVEMFTEVFEKLDVPFTEELRQRCATLNKRPTSMVSGAPKLEKWRQRNPEAIESIIEQICPMQQTLGYDCNV